jgi:hypothetical protein
LVVEVGASAGLHVGGRDAIVDADQIDIMIWPPIVRRRKTSRCEVRG